MATEKFILAAQIKLDGQKNIQNLINDTSNLTRISSQLQGTLERQNARIMELDKLYKAGSISTEDYIAEQQALNKEVETLSVSMEGLIKSTKGYTDSIYKVNKAAQELTITEAFEDVTKVSSSIAVGMEQVLESFNSLSGGVIEQSGALRDVQEGLAAITKIRAAATALLTAKQQAQLAFTKAQSVAEAAYLKISKLVSTQKKADIETNKELNAQLNQQSDGLIKSGAGAKKSGSAFKSGSIGIKAFKIGLASLGIGLIIIAITELSEVIMDNIKIIGEITAQVKALGASIKAFFTGESATEAYAKSLAKGREAIANELKRNNAEVLDAFNELNDALLDGNEENNKRRRLLQKENLQRQAEIEKTALLTQSKFSKEELDIITNATNLTNEEWIKQINNLKARFDGQEQIYSQDIELLRNYTSAQASLLKEQNTDIATTAAEEARIARSRAEVISAQYERIKTSEGELARARANFAADFAEFRKKEIAGEFLSEEERINTLNALNARFEAVKLKVREEAFIRSRERAVAQRNEELKGIVDFNKRRELIEKNFIDEIEVLKAKQRLGEAVSQAEFLLAETKKNNAIVALDRQRTAQQLALDKQRLVQAQQSEERKIALLDRRFDRENKYQILSLERIEENEKLEIEGIRRIAQLREAEILGQIDNLNKLKSEGLITDENFNKEFERLQNDRIVIATETDNRIQDANTKANERMIANEQRRTQLFIQQTNLRLNEEELAFSRTIRELDELENSYKKVIQTSSNLLAIGEKRRLLEENIRKEATAKQTQLLNESQAQIDINNRKIEELRLQKEQTEEIRNTIKELENANVKISIDVQAQVEDLEKEAEETIKSLSSQFSDKLIQGVQNPLKAGFATILEETKILGNEAATAVGQALQQVAAQAFELFEQQQAARLAALETEQQNIAARRQDIDTAIEESRKQVAELENELSISADNFDQSSLAKRNAIESENAAIDAQIAERERLAKQEIANQKEIDKLKKAQAKRNKAIAAAQVIQQTAIAIISALAEVPKVDFGITAGIISAAYGAIGAVQLANVLATPDSQFAEQGGYLSEDGNLIKLADGGILQGKSHAFGGIRGTGKFNNIEVEGGEAIIPKKVVEKNPKLVRKLIESGQVENEFSEYSAEFNYSADMNSMMEAFLKYANRPTLVQVTDIVSAVGEYNKAEINRSIFK